MTNQTQFRLDKRLLRRAFERAAKTYDSVAVLQVEVGNRLLQRLEMVKLKPDVVLDVGAGTGHCTQQLIKRYRSAKVIALDIALAMLHQTKRRCGRFRRPRLICADAETLPLIDAGIDVIYSNLTLQWCNDLEQTLREFQRVMTPGGLLTFTTFGPETLQELRSSWSETDRFNHVNAFYDMHDIGDLLIRTGFADPVVDMEMMRLTYTDGMQLMRELKLIGAQNRTQGRPRGLTGKLRLRRLLQAYEAFRTEEGVLPATYEVIYGHAWSPLARRDPRNQPSDGEIVVPFSRIKRVSGYDWNRQAGVSSGARVHTAGPAPHHKDP